MGFTFRVPTDMSFFSENHNQSEFWDFSVNLEFPEIHPKYDFSNPNWQKSGKLY